MSWIPVQNKNKYIYIFRYMIWYEIRLYPCLFKTQSLHINLMKCGQIDTRGIRAGIPYLEQSRFLQAQKPNKRVFQLNLQGGRAISALLQPGPGISATNRRALCFLQDHSVQSQLCWEALPRDISSPESPNTILPYKTKGPSFSISKAFYTDKVYSSQLLCILVKEPWGFPPHLPAKYNFWSISAEYLHPNLSRAKVTHP